MNCKDILCIVEATRFVNRVDAGFDYYGTAMSKPIHLMLEFSAQGVSYVITHVEENIFSVKLSACDEHLSYFARYDNERQRLLPIF